MRYCDYDCNKLKRSLHTEVENKCMDTKGQGVYGLGDWGWHRYIQFSSVQSLSCVWLLATPWTAAHQVSPSMGFSRQEYWSGVPLPSPIWKLTYHLIYVNFKGRKMTDLRVRHLWLFGSHLCHSLLVWYWASHCHLHNADKMVGSIVSKSLHGSDSWSFDQVACSNSSMFHCILELEGGLMIWSTCFISQMLFTKKAEQILLSFFYKLKY